MAAADLISSPKQHYVEFLGQRLSAQDFDKQVTEIQSLAAVLKRFTELGIPQTEAEG